MTRHSLVPVALTALTLTASACHHKAAVPTTSPTPMQAAPPPSSAPSSAPVDRTAPSSAPMGDNGNAAMTATNTIGDRIHFAYNVADIADSDRTRLDAKAAVLKRYPALRIRVTGHADERGSDEYNIALGMRRAAAAKEYLVRVGIDAGRIDVASLGRQAPIDTGENEAAYSANRRDEFEIIAGSQSLRGQ